MGWAIGTGANGRDIGYGVPAICDKPGCNNKIDRGLSYCCGEFISDNGCGLYFCLSHLAYRKPRYEEQSVLFCLRCNSYKPPYEPKEDIEEWQHWKLIDVSWEQWRKENPEEVEKLRATVHAAGDHDHDW